MADKPKTNVDKFFEIYDADPALQARVQQAMDSYPGSLEIRDVMTEHVLLPVAEELGLPFTLKELRNYELLKWGRQHQDRELTDDEMAADDETTYWAARPRLVERRGCLLRRRALRYAKKYPDGNCAPARVFLPVTDGNVRRGCIPAQ